MMEMVLDRRITTTLSAAVLFKDDFTKKKEVIGKINITIPSLNLKAVKNPSGYYNFFDLPMSPPKHKLEITSDFYIIDEEKELDIPLPDPPVYPVTLKPCPLYPFPIWATLLRGVVSDSNGNPIPGAAVECVAKGLSTTTSAKGEFVLYFPLDQEDETIQIKVTPQGKPSINITNVEVKKCKTTSLSVTYL